jgi:hypothetical protein
MKPRIAKGCDKGIGIWVEGTCISCAYKSISDAMSSLLNMTWFWNWYRQRWVNQTTIYDICKRTWIDTEPIDVEKECAEVSRKLREAFLVW